MSILGNKVLIIARYNDPLNWLDKVPKDIKPIIYNKGLQNITSNKQLENIGRESHTYLTFILDFYNDLPEHCIFFQDDALQHKGWPPATSVIDELYQLPKFNYKGFDNRIPVTGLEVKPPHITNNMPYTPEYLYTHILKQDAEKVKNISYVMTTCAFFYVHRSNILRHKKEIYQFLYEEHYKHTWMPWTMEYSWHLIFDDAYYPN